MTFGATVKKRRIQYEVRVGDVEGGVREGDQVWTYPFVSAEKLVVTSEAQEDSRDNGGLAGTCNARQHPVVTVRSTVITAKERQTGGGVGWTREQDAPFGPTTKLRPGPGKTSTSLHTWMFWSRTRTIRQEGQGTGVGGGGGECEDGRVHWKCRRRG